MVMSQSIEFRLLPPTLLPLSPERERRAVRLLTELLLAEVTGRRGGVSGGDFGGTSEDGFVVASFPGRREKVRKAV
jgi:hypothetical protein